MIITIRTRIDVSLTATESLEDGEEKQENKIMKVT